MTKWYMVGAVGPDRPGIVSRVTAALHDGDCNLGEASMIRLGGNFTMMLMVQSDASESALKKLLAPAMESLDLHFHIDRIKGELHHHVDPDVSITLYGEDRGGIVAHAATVLAAAGLHIVSLESDVAGSDMEPVYVLHIEGKAEQGIPALESALEIVAAEGVETRLVPIEAGIE